MHQLRLLILIVVIALSCSEQNSLGPDNRNGHLIVDTLEISVLRDETPGFLYPRMQHYVKFRGRFDTIGQFGGYSFNDGYVYQAVAIDGDPVPNATFRMDGSYWHEELLEPGTVVQYTLGIAADGGPYVFESNTTVKLYTDGPQPEANSRQITGIENMKSAHSLPVFSRDGQWIYYLQSFQSTSSIFRIPKEEGTAELIIGPVETISNFTLTNNDSTIVYVVHNDVPTEAEINVYGLFSHSGKKLIPDGIIFGKPVPIPATNKVICFWYPENSSKAKGILSLIDFKTGARDSLIDADGISYYTLRPGSKEIYFIKSKGWPLNDIYVLNPENGEINLFKEDYTGNIITWAPNGRDYALEVDGKIYLYQSGVEHQLTTYPGQVQEIAFAPDGNSIAFATWRRGEKQIWINDF